MMEGRLPKKADAIKQPGSTKRGRPQVRWEVCAKRDVRNAEADKWTLPETTKKYARMHLLEIARNEVYIAS